MSDESESTTDINFFNRTKKNASVPPETPVIPERVDEISTDIPEDPADIYYNMSGDKFLIIFNHFTYLPREKHTPTDRNGTKADVKRMTELFKSLNFKISKYKDLKYRQIMDILLQVISDDHSNTSCVVVAIFTHGNEGGYLEAYDKSYQLAEIHNKFIYSYNKHLVNIPKLFFIQACRGKGIDVGRIGTDGTSPNYGSLLLPTHIGFLTMYSSVPDFVSWRDMYGSWLIQELCNAIETNRDRDLLQIITLTNRAIAKRVSCTPLNESTHCTKQMPETQFTLTKLLKF